MYVPPSWIFEHVYMFCTHAQTFCMFRYSKGSANRGSTDVQSRDDIMITWVATLRQPCVHFCGLIMQREMLIIFSVVSSWVYPNPLSQEAPLTILYSTFYHLVHNYILIGVGFCSCVRHHFVRVFCLLSSEHTICELPYRRNITPWNVGIY